MHASTDPVAHLPLAVAGIVVGAVLALGSGYALHLQWGEESGSNPSSLHTTLVGITEWAGWRASAVPEGPDWYLEVRLEDRPRGFLVTTDRLSEGVGSQYGSPGANQRIPALTGKQATVVVDSTLLARPAQHPYLSGLRVNGEIIVPEKSGGSDEWSAWESSWLGVLLALGVLVGLAFLGASLQHAVVCVLQRRAWQGRPRGDSQGP